MENQLGATSNLLGLAQGPDRVVTSVDGYMVNGSMFRTKDSEMVRDTQNSGVVVMGENDREYYGVLRDIIEVQYIGGNRVILFKCDWWDVHSPGRGILTDCFKVISINTEKVLLTDPYVLACQVGQVFYVDDVVKPNWKVVVKTTPRNFFDVPEKNDEDRVDVIGLIEAT